MPRLMPRSLFRWLSVCVLLVTSVALPASVLALNASTQVLDNPIKSEVDTRSYRNIVLANGMKVLLISDPVADKAAAAVDVATGSNNDPVQRQGLAHFLEHMLFLGTKKYPQSDEYQAFISAHGGSHNAYTSLEHTNYFFDIDPVQLKPALDRFSQFFIAPLFDATYVDREKNAVNSEYQARIRDDDRRINDVFRELYDKRNPASGFSVGSLETLADKPESKVRDDLLKYYQEHYSANIMTLAVLGRESLDDLQTMVEADFSAVPNKQLVIDRSPKPVFRSGLLPATVSVQSINDARHLRLIFPVSEQETLYRTKPADYITSLLGHEGKGSLLYVLKQKGWAESLMAGSGLDNHFAATMDVDIKLTAEGYKHTDDIVALFFDVVNKIKQGGIEEWRYKEQKSMRDIGFRFSEKADAMMTVSGAAGSLQYYPAMDVLNGSVLMEKFDKNQIVNLLDKLQPQNMLVVISAPDIQSDKRSQYYSAPYRVSAVTNHEMQAWQSPTPEAMVALPEKNLFIPDALALKSQKKASESSEDIPKNIEKFPGYSLWFSQGTRFHVPKGFIKVYMRSAETANSARNAALSQLLSGLLYDKLNSELYPAMLGGLTFSSVPSSRGIVFRFFGYSEKLPVLMNMVMEQFSKPDFKEDRFRLLKQQYIDALRNDNKQPPYAPLMQDIATVLVHGNWERNQLLSALEKITLQDVLTYAQLFQQSIDSDVLVYGNFDKDDAEQLGNIVQNTVGTLRKEHEPALYKVAVVPEASQPALYVDAIEHNDAAIVKYFQLPADSVEQNVRMNMLDQVLAPAFFNSLRTEQQLGYIVSERGKAYGLVPGLVFVVESPAHDVADINRRIEQFLQQYFKDISQRDDAWFAQQKKALMVQFEEKPKNMAEQADNYFVDLTLGFTNFDSRQQDIAALQKMTRQDLLDAYQKTFLQKQRRELLLVSPGKLGIEKWLQGEAKAYHRIDNVDIFKKNQPAFSL